MRRRDFIASLGVAATWPLVARAAARCAATDRRANGIYRGEGGL
jgi:hypothetical protein